MTFWAVKAEEIKLREANDGIRSKLRATTPCAVIFRTEKGETVKRFELEESVWAKIGLVPTKKDFERTARDYKKAIHAAAKASFDTLGFRVALPREAEQPVPQPAEVPAAVTVETTAGTVAEQAGAKSKGKGRNAGRNKATEQPAAGQSQEQPAEVTAETTAGAVSEQAAGQQPSTDMKTAA